jgi:chemotaxis protein methyltransferase CheR
VRQKHNFDFGNYALNAFRLKLDIFLRKNNYRNADQLIANLEIDKDFYDEFLHGISIPTTEIFRDHEVWTFLKEIAIPQLTGLFENLQIWFPDAVDGTDIYSMYIFLKETGQEDKVNLIASCFSDKSVALINSGEFNNKALDISVENFEKLGFGTNLLDYFIKIDKKYYFNTKGISKIHIFKQNPEFEPLPETVQMIFFRNKLINYCPSYQAAVLNKLVERLNKNGIIVFGSGENLLDYEIKFNTLLLVKEMAFVKL